VNDAGGNPISLKYLCSFKRLIDHNSRRKKRYVISLSKNPRLANFEFIRFLKNRWKLRPRKPHVRGSPVLYQGSYYLLRLHSIGRNYHGHIGKYTHKGYILKRLVCSPVFSHSNPGMGCDYLYVEIWKRD